MARARARARRRLLIFAIGACVLLSLYATVVRDLPAFAIESVELEGASSGYSPQLLADLRAATRSMTTLHVDEARLLDVAGRYPAVTSLTTNADFPHGLVVTVAERPPVGIVPGPDGDRVPVSGDGTLLEGQPVDRPLPRLPGRASSGRRARRAETAAAARIVAGAPAPLAAWLDQVRRGSTGWTVELREGPDLRFGTSRALEAKWRAAAAVLASRRARGAGYVDLRLPDRPAAGGYRAERTAPVDDTSETVAGPASASETNTQSVIEAIDQP